MQWECSELVAQVVCRLSRKNVPLCRRKSVELKRFIEMKNVQLTLRFCGCVSGTFVCVCACVKDIEKRARRQYKTPEERKRTREKSLKLIVVVQHTSQHCVVYAVHSHTHIRVATHSSNGIRYFIRGTQHTSLVYVWLPSAYVRHSTCALYICMCSHAWRSPKKLARTMRS